MCRRQRPSSADIVRGNARLVADNGAAAPWCGYLAVSPTAGAIGACAFKSAPEGRTVEIAYVTFPPFEGRGHAKAMAKRLIEIAEASGEVDSLLAHSLAEENASTAILRAAGFSWSGSLEGPEDGPIWRWQKPVGRKASARQMPVSPSW